MKDEAFHVAVATLLTTAGLKGDFSLSLLPGGRNNRVYRVETGDGKALLRVYFHGEGDPRDRLGAEFSFSRFAWEHGVRVLPKPLASDPQHHLGLYEFVQGRRLLPDELTDDMVQQAINFYVELNRHKRQPRVMDLPNASEACFSIAEHLQRVDQRVQDLMKVDGPAGPGIDREASVFIRNELSTTWRRILDSARRQASQLDIPIGESLSPEDRCLSPSDFGFHNALLTDGGRLRFIDFEYAGWDDPAKTVCDFFCQPTLPVPMTHYERFVTSVTSDLSGPERHRWRMGFLLPVYVVKWCGILLNDFLPVGGQRRRFSQRILDEEAQKAEQLHKARVTLQRVA